MPKTKGADVMRAAERAQRAGRRAIDAERAYTKALKSCDRAEAVYLQLVSESVAVRPRDPPNPTEEMSTAQ